MPRKILPRRLHFARWRHADLLTVELVLLLAVVEIGLQSRTNPQPIVGGDRHVAPIEERVEVGPEQDAIINAMSPSLADRPYVSRLKNRKGLLSCYSAPATV